MKTNPTNEEIEAEMTPAGGFTRETLARWGVPWPPPKGWKRKLLSEAPCDKGAHGDAVGLTPWTRAS